MNIDDELHKITKRVVALCKGPTVLSKHLGVTVAAIAQWRRIPSDHLEIIEAFIDGTVSAEEMRPDRQPESLSSAYLIQKIRRTTDKLDRLPGVSVSDRKRAKKIKAALK